MGICASSQIQYTTNYKAVRMRINGPLTAQIIHWDGSLEELKQPLKAAQILSRSPNCFLCSSESMFVGTHPPQLAADDDLQLGQIYFLLPLSPSRAPLSLPDLCALAIMASSALSRSGYKGIYGFQGYYCKVTMLDISSVHRGNRRIEL